LSGAAALEGRREEGVAFVLDLTEAQTGGIPGPTGVRELTRSAYPSSDQITGFSGNPAFERRWGYAPDTFIGKHVASFWMGRL